MKCTEKVFYRAKVTAIKILLLLRAYIIIHLLASHVIKKTKQKKNSQLKRKQENNCNADRQASRRVTVEGRARSGTMAATPVQAATRSVPYASVGRSVVACVVSSLVVRYFRLEITHVLVILAVFDSRSPIGFVLSSNRRV